MMELWSLQHTAIGSHTSLIRITNKPTRFTKRAAENGHPLAMRNFAICLANSIGIAEPDPAEAMIWYRRAAEADDTQAMVNLALNLERGRGVPEPDPEAAMIWYRRAAEADDAKAMVNLAVNLQQGMGVPAPDPAEAMIWYRRAAEADNTQAMVYLAVNLEQGMGVPAPDPAEAMIWYRRAAEADDTQAMVYLAVNLEQGMGVPTPDPAEAMVWYRRAAEADYTQAMFNLAVNLEQGMGVPAPDPAEAMIWYRRAAEAGHDVAIAVLAAYDFAQGKSKRSPDSQGMKPSIAVTSFVGDDEPPNIGVKWRNVEDAAEVVQVFTKIVEAANRTKLPLGETQAVHVRLAPLVFYPGCDLVDVALLQKKQHERMYLSALVNDRGALILDGTSPSIHAINPKLLDVSKRAAALAYLRFFCEFVRGENEPFHILDGMADIDWSEAPDPNVLQQLTKHIELPTVVSADETQIMRFQTHLRHGGAVFAAEFSVKEDGVVDMLSDRLLASDLPIRRAKYSGAFRKGLTGE